MRFEVRENGTGGPIVFWGTSQHQENEVPRLWDCLMEVVPDSDFLLAVFQAEDWNRDFSPWKAPAVFGIESFSGSGRKTLHWLSDAFVPSIEKQYGGGRQRYLAGYSLAGLFSLWAAYECSLFSGVACCSGSLWYKDWDRYVQSHHIQSESHIYLSLGGKEEKTRNPVMAAIGARTREQEKILRADPMVKRTVLEWNPGGHFSDPEKRLAKGIRWLLQNERKL